MKTLFHIRTSIFIFLFSGFISMTVHAQYARNVLIENFGGFYHQSQGDVVGWIENLTEEFPGQVIPICYYVTPCLAGCDPDDPLSLYKTASIDNRSFYYPYHTAPATDVYVDGIYGFLPWALGWSSPIPPCSDSTILQRVLVPSPISIAVQHSFSAAYDTMHIHVEITAANTFTGGTNAKLRVTPIEESIEFPEVVGTYNWSTTSVPRVVRDMTPDQIGVYVGTINAGATVSYDFDWKINNVYDLNKLRAVAFVQDDLSFEVIQAGQSQFVPIFLSDCSVNLSKKYYCPQNGSNVYPEIEIRNDGFFNIHNLTIDYGILGGTMYNTTWTGNFPPNTSMTMALNFPLLPPGSNILDVSVQSDLPYDSKPHNNFLHYEPLANENNLQFTTFYVPGLINYPFTENFESGTYPPVGWVLETTAGNDQWSPSANGGYMASATSILAPLGTMFKYHLHNERTILISPVIDFSSAVTPVLSFDLAYKCKDYGSVPSDYDTLNIWASADCGDTWQLIYSKDQSQITTATPCSFTNMWTPQSASDWMTDTVSMVQLAGQSSVLLRFEAVSGEGQSLYLDNINLAEGFVTGIAQNNATEIMLYPNPAADELSVSIPHLADMTHITFNLFDVTGRKVVTSKIVSELTRISCSDLESGIYTAEIENNSSVVLRKEQIIR